MTLLHSCGAFDDLVHESDSPMPVRDGTRFKLEHSIKVLDRLLELRQVVVGAASAIERLGVVAIKL